MYFLSLGVKVVKKTFGVTCRTLPFVSMGSNTTMKNPTTDTAQYRPREKAVEWDRRTCEKSS